MIDMMRESLLESGVEIAMSSKAEKVLLEGNKVRGLMINGKEVGCKALVSNGSLPRTILN